MNRLQNDGGEFVDRDTEDYFQWLPNEMIVKIFSKLKHPKDLLSCSRVCRRWEGLLHSESTSFCFYEVLPYLSKHLEWTRNILALRLVCKSWKIAAEDHLDGNYPTAFPKCATPDCWMVPFFQSDEKVRRFLSLVENMSPFHNPIPTRGISFTPETDSSEHEHPDEIRPLVLPFLQQFGEHIWRSQVTLDFQNDEGTTLDVETLFECLRQMPNLKHLDLYGPEDSLPLSPEEEERLLDYVNNHDHPTLNNLLTLTAYTYPLPLRHPILSACCEVLEELEFDGITSFENLNFPRLRKLCMGPTEYVHRSGPSLVHLYAPMLTELRLIFNINQGDIGPLAEALRNCGESLKVLYLEVNQFPGYLNMDEFRELKLQRLRQFMICPFQLESFDFLPGFAPFLEHFIVNVQPLHWHEKTHVMKRNSIGIEGFGLECVCDSDIWNILPKLKKIDIRILGRGYRTCSRQNRDDFEKQRILGCDQAGAAKIPCPFHENSESDSDFDSDELEEDMEDDVSDIGNNNDDDSDDDLEFRLDIDSNSDEGNDEGLN